MKMTGENCCLLEVNIWKFADILCRGKPISDPLNKTLKNIVMLYTKFHDIAQDLQSTSGNLERAQTFKHRGTTFMKSFSALQRLTVRIE